MRPSHRALSVDTPLQPSLYSLRAAFRLKDGTVNGPLRIDHWNIVSRSLRFAWKHKILWILGFFASVSGENVLSWAQDRGSSFHDYLLPRLDVLAVAVVGLVLLWIGLLVVNTLCRAALIAASSNADQGVEAAFESSLSAGLRAFVGMLALLAIAVVAFLAATLACIVPVVLPLAGGVPGIVIAVVIGAVLFVPYLAFLFGLVFTITFAERALVIEHLPIPAALGVGWRMMRTHFWAALVGWLVAFLTGIAYVFGLIAALLVAAAPFILIGLVHRTLGFVLGIPVAVILVLAATGAFGTYRFAFWTLLYRGLRGAAAGPRGGTHGPAGPTGEPRDGDRPAEPREDLLAGSI
jgi:hypothetical protein